MRADPFGLAHTACELPTSCCAIAARHSLDLAADRAPGENAVGLSEHLVRNVLVEIGRDHRADATLTEAPCGAGVSLRHLLEHLHERLERRLRTAKRLRQQRSVETVVDQS